MRRPRGITFITVLLMIGAVAMVGWILTYGPAYWDNTEVNRVVKEAANMCYRTTNDAMVRDFVFKQLHQLFDTEERDSNGDKIMSIDVSPDDLRIERRTDPKPWVDVWLTYQRTVKMPLIDQERTVTFYDHAEQDLSPVKW